MKMAYTFCVLRYVHDVVSGEFVNVGVALHAPQAKFLDAACTTTYGRLSMFFGGIESEQFKRLMRHVQAGIEDLGERLRSELPFEGPAANVRGWVDQVLPPDDSSLRFSEPSGGLTNDPVATLEQLYQRFVEQYAKREQRPTRSDEDVLRVFREPLARRRLTARVRPKRIAGRDYEHEFPIAWKNGIWHASEAVSFDLANAGDLLEKANRWLGRGVNLRESEEKFKLVLLLGAPRDPKLRSVFASAKNVLHKIPGEHELVGEDDAEDFAAQVERDLAEQHNEE
jgi:hypothetical protein